LEDDHRAPPPDLLWPRAGPRLWRRGPADLGVL